MEMLLMKNVQLFLELLLLLSGLVHLKYLKKLIKKLDNKGQVWD
jgi:hypothetical protein